VSSNSHPRRIPNTWLQCSTSSKAELLSGAIRPSGNKNAALPIIAASLLTEHPVTLTNVPRIRDTETLVELIRSVGASADWTERNTLQIHARDIRPLDLDPDLCRKIRASILLAGPLLARCGEITLPPPGGDVIGRRRLDTHFLALERLGADVHADDKFELRAKALIGADVFLDEPSVTATENALVAATAARGTTILRNAACEPHVQDLALPLHVGREDRRNRNQYRHDPWRADHRRRLASDRPGPHRGRLLHRLAAVLDRRFASGGRRRASSLRRSLALRDSESAAGSKATI
jgi:hypothetical protein